MVTLLECIERIPDTLRTLIKTRENNLTAVSNYIRSDARTIREIYIVGSGSSYNAAMSARGFIEKMTKVPVHIEASNPFLFNRSIWPEDALYIFQSQSGTSVTTRRAHKMIQEKGLLTIGITANPGEYLSQEVGAHIDMMCFSEEYKTRTIGYCAGIMTLQLLGLTLGQLWGALTQKQVTASIDEMIRCCENHSQVEAATTQWFMANREQIMNAKYYAVFGNDDLWGVALEGALKIMEIGKSFAAGYELEEGMHGPTLAFSNDLCIFVLNNGGRENERAIGLGRFSKEQFNNGFVIGENTIENKDLQIPLSSTLLSGYDFTCVLQVLCWHMAQDKGVDLTKPIAENEKPYFQTHNYQ